VKWNEIIRTWFDDLNFFLNQTSDKKFGAVVRKGASLKRQSNGALQDAPLSFLVEMV